MRISQWLQWVNSPRLLAFIAGAGVIQLMPALPPLWLLLLLLLILVCAVAVSRRFAALRLLQPLQPLLLLLCFALAGSGYASWRAELRLTSPLPDDLIWRDIVVEGVVKGFPAINDRRTRFDFQIEKLHAPREQPLHITARLNDYHSGSDSEPSLVIREGNRLRLKVRMRVPDNRINPHGFDYAGYLFTRNILLSGYVRERDNIQLLHDNSGGIRRQLYERIHTSKAQHAPLLAALIIGDRSGLNNEQWSVLQRTGTAHLVSVSGMHLGFIFLLVALFIGNGWRLSPVLTRFLPATAAALLVAVPIALAYALLSGFAVPVQRSFFMALTAALIVFYSGGRGIMTPLTLAALVVILLDPWALLAAGFWLSFLLTAVVLLTLAGNQRKRALWLELVYLQLILSIAAIPLTLWFFNQASFISPLANLPAVPLITLVVLPLSLLGTIAGDWCWLLAGWLLDFLWDGLHWLSQLPYAALTPAKPPLWLFALALAGIVWLILPRGVPWRSAGLLPIVAMLLWQPPLLPTGALKMTVLDVGQGTAVVLQTRKHTLVYDTGRTFGGAMIASYLHGEGIGNINTLIISHDDYDHRGGMNLLLRAITADSIIAADTDTPCRRGTTWEYDKVTFEFLHPDQVTLQHDNNDSSCVLLVQSASGKRALLTGDISSVVEDTLNTRADVLLVSHHGSRYSSSSIFLNQVNAAAAVISVGRNNYNHPHPQTLKRLTDAGSRIYRTDRDGAVIVHLAQSVAVTRWRDEYKRYWQKHQ